MKTKETRLTMAIKADVNLQTAVDKRLNESNSFLSA